MRNFQSEKDAAALDALICAILQDYRPRKSGPSIADQPGSTRLIEDLGFDSLSITEVVFVTEDMLNITIANEELVRIRTLDDLRGFIRQKVAATANG